MPFSKCKFLMASCLFILGACGGPKDDNTSGSAALPEQEKNQSNGGEQEWQKAHVSALQDIAANLETVQKELHDLNQMQGEILNPKKPLSEPVFGQATSFTVASNKSLYDLLPFEDESDFQDASRGLIAQIPDGKIFADDGRVVWDLSRFSFLTGESPDTVNPSLWRQAKLNMLHGLFEVAPGLYQIRGYDLAVMTVIRGETGWVVIDPLLTKETAAASLALVNKQLGERPVTAVLYTHSHADHFGGVRGIVTDEQIKNGEVRIIGPEGVEEHAISENIIAGNAMTRRAQFQFGFNLDVSPTGIVDSGIGKGLSTGTIGFIAPTEEISVGGESVMIDGVEFVFHMAHGTEAPAEFTFFLPKYKAVHVAEIAVGTLHNVLTPRGAQVRDALAWADAINDLLVHFGDDVEIVLGSHNWPTWGNQKSRELLQAHRDVYRYIHDQTMRLANSGYTMHEIPPLLGEPDFMRQEFSVRGYYGSVNHNARATYQRYFGWWDGNPANLDPLPPADEAERLVELAGGEQNILHHAIGYYDRGDYRWAAKLLNSLVFANPENVTGRNYLSACYEQLGFQAESAIFRNYYLAAAVEVRNGGPAGAPVRTITEDFVRAVSTHQYFDALAVRVDPTADKKMHAVHFSFSDTDERVRVIVQNGTATHFENQDIGPGDVTVQLTRADLDEITLGVATFQSKLKNGAIRIDGDPQAFVDYLSVHTQFDANFNVVTP